MQRIGFTMAKVSIKQMCLVHEAMIIIALLAQENLIVYNYNKQSDNIWQDMTLFTK